MSNYNSITLSKHSNLFTEGDFIKTVKIVCFLLLVVQVGRGIKIKTLFLTFCSLKVEFQKYLSECASVLLKKYSLNILFFYDQKFGLGIE